jgi:serine/threonine-protein kinase
VPAELGRIITRAMARDPAERFADARELRIAIARFLQHRVADELAADALARFRELTARLDAGEEPSRDDLYELFGECRFGFLHARTLWPESPEANNGLRDAVGRMVDYELQRGDASAAAALLAELEQPPAQLEERVAAALADADREAERIRQLEQLGKDLDPEVGRRARMLFGLTVGGVWCLAPLIGIIRVNLRDDPIRSWELVVWPLAFLAFLAVVGFGARRALFRSAINRRLFGSFVFAMSAMLVFHLNLLHLGFSPPLCQVLDTFLWFCVGAAVTTFVDLRLGFATAGYLIAFLAAAERPDLRFVFVLAANLTLTANIFWLWKSTPAGRRRAEPG